MKTMRNIIRRTHVKASILAQVQNIACHINPVKKLGRRFIQINFTTLNALPLAGQSKVIGGSSKTILLTDDNLQCRVHPNRKRLDAAFYLAEVHFF